MKTAALIELLARNAGPAPRAVVARRLAPAMLMGVAASSALALMVIGPLPGAVFTTPAPWIKLAYALGLGGAAALLTARLSRPVSRLSAPRILAIGVVAAVALLGAVSLALTPASERLSAVLGQTWVACPWLLMGFSLPALAGLLWAVRGLAPTQPRRAGFACGLLAGCLGALGYSLACPESSASFVAIWYSLGIGMTALVGGGLGPGVLRW